MSFSIFAKDFEIGYTYDNIYKSGNDILLLHNIDLEYKNSLEISSKYGRYISEKNKIGILNLELKSKYKFLDFNIGALCPSSQKFTVNEYIIKKNEILIPYIYSEINLKTAEPFIFYSCLDSSAILNPFSIQIENSRIIGCGTQINIKKGKVSLFYTSARGDVKINEIIEAARLNLVGYGADYSNKYITLGITRVDSDSKYNISRENSSILSLAGETKGEINGAADLLFGKIQKKLKGSCFDFEFNLFSFCIIQSNIYLDTYQKTREYRVISMFPFFETEVVENEETHKYFFEKYAFGGLGTVSVGKDLWGGRIYIKKIIPFGNNLSLKDKYEISSTSTGENGGEGGEGKKDDDEFQWEKVILSGLTAGVSFSF